MDILTTTRRRLALAAVLAAATIAAPARSEATQSLSAYEVKAAFLVNFTKFVTWPAAAFTSATAPIVIGIIGEDPFGAPLDDAARKQRVDGRPIEVRRIGARDDLSPYHLIYISESETRQLDQILQRIETTHAIAVSDIDRFTSSGGIIGFVADGSRVRFEINVAFAERRGLRISTRLISLAAKVHTR